jgi:hypothetical protein
MTIKYVCRSCGQIVIASTPPRPMKWTDGHVCYFVPETKSPEQSDNKKGKENEY